jgi:hypothetical protein
MLSAPRFDRYLRDAHGDVDWAMRLYWWNVEVSAAFYGPLHCLELTLRNAINDRLSAYYDVAEWWSVAPLTTDGRRKVDGAVRDVALRRQGGRRPGDVVAALTFGFWVSLLSRSYDRPLWVPTLHRAFSHYSGRRSDLHDNFFSMLLFRNRIMHHEPIYHRDLVADHAKIYRLVGYLSQDVRDTLSALDRAPNVLAHRSSVRDPGHRPSF